MWRDLLDGGATEFTGRQEYVTADARVVALVVDGRRVSSLAAATNDEPVDVDVVLDRTPFYAESGGQVGDTGTITTAGGAHLTVTDTQYGLPGLVVHRARLDSGTIDEGDFADAAIDVDRRDAIRRNHTATHLLHWALRDTLGTHVAQAGSMVSADRLRFDFSHDAAVSPAQLAAIEALANHEVISDAPVRHYETTKDHAESLGAIAFFGDKYGDLVRVLEAGEHSLELCGGTHVHALGFIGPIKIVSEGSVGANLRRIEALTGDRALEYVQREEQMLRDVAGTLQVTPAEIPDRIQRLLDEVRALRQERDTARARDAVQEAGTLAQGASDRLMVARRDLGNDDLRRLAVATRDALGSGIVVLAGTVPPDGAKAAIAVAVSADLVATGASAGEIAGPAARLLGGGTAKNPDIAVGGGPKADAVDAALTLAAEAARAAITAAGA